ncbi:MAG: O-antigen ligase family protein [Alphaproteobacteria bacterium]
MLPIATAALAFVSAQQLPYVLCGAAGICVLRPGFWRTPPAHFTPFVAIVAVLCVWIAVSAVWTVEPVTSRTRPILMALFALCGLALIRATVIADARDRAWFQYGGVAALVLLAILFGFEIATQGSLTGAVHGESEWFRRAQNLQAPVVLAALTLPLFLMRPRSPATVAGAIVAWLAALYVAWTISTGSALMTLAIIAIVFPVALAWPRITIKIMAAVVLLGLFAAPVIPPLLPVGPWLRDVPDNYRISFYHRIKIWQFTTERIREKPFFGWGIDASRAMPGATAKISIDQELGFDPPRHHVRGELLPLHPHNNFLQIWLELGLVGVVLVALLLFLMFRYVARVPGREDRAALLATAAGAVAVGMVAYGLTQTRWVCFIWLLAAFGAGLTYPAPGRKSTAA